MDDHVVRRLVRGGLEAYTDPAVTAVHLLEGARGDGVRVGEEALGRVVFPIEPVDDEPVLVAQHVPQAAFAHEAITGLRAVDRVAEVLVVGAHRLGDRLRCAA